VIQGDGYCTHGSISPHFYYIILLETRERIRDEQSRKCRAKERKSRWGVQLSGCSVSSVNQAAEDNGYGRECL
jgi:hypothetical protein